MHSTPLLTKGRRRREREEMMPVSKLDQVTRVVADALRTQGGTTMADSLGELRKCRNMERRKVAEREEQVRAMRGKAKAAEAEAAMEAAREVREAKEAGAAALEALAARHETYIEGWVKTKDGESANEAGEIARLERYVEEGRAELRTMREQHAQASVSMKEELRLMEVEKTAAVAAAVAAGEAAADVAVEAAVEAAVGAAVDGAEEKGRATEEKLKKVVSRFKALQQQNKVLQTELAETKALATAADAAATAAAATAAELTAAAAASTSRHGHGHSYLTGSMYSERGERGESGDAGDASEVRRPRTQSYMDGRKASLELRSALERSNSLALEVASVLLLVEEVESDHDEVRLEGGQEAAAGQAGSVKQCASCSESKKKAAFSANQWKNAKKKPPKCKVCTAAASAAGSPAATTEAVGVATAKVGEKGEKKAGGIRPKRASTADARSAAMELQRSLARSNSLAGEVHEAMRLMEELDLPSNVPSDLPSGGASGGAAPPTLRRPPSIIATGGAGGRGSSGGGGGNGGGGKGGGGGGGGGGGRNASPSVSFADMSSFDFPPPPPHA